MIGISLKMLSSNVHSFKVDKVICCIEYTYEENEVSKQDHILQNIWYETVHLDRLLKQYKVRL